MNIHPFEKENYGILCEWASARKVNFPQLQHLPPTGRIVASDGLAIAAGFLCKTDAGSAVICSLISNPTADKDDRQSGIDFLMTYFSDLAKREGFSMICISTSLDKFKPRISAKFQKFEENVVIYGNFL